MTANSFGRVESLDLARNHDAESAMGERTDRPVAVLIHGITSSSLSWIRVAPRLAERTRVIAVDLKGHGDSDRPADGYSVTDQAREIGELCGVLELGQIELFGHSIGGGIALQMAADGRA